jgi:hypothetical protein
MLKSLFAGAGSVCVALLLGLGACSASDDSPAASTGAGVDAGQDAPGLQCELPASFGAPECNECMAELCCDAITDCSADTACDTELTCLLGCMNEADQDACLEGCFPSGEPSEGVLSVVDCTGAYCDSQCTG